MADLKPQQLGGSPKEPVIYTIPDQFYGLASKAQLPKEISVPSAPAAPAAPAPAVGAATPPPVQKASKKWLLIPLIAVVLLGGMGVLAWQFLFKKPAPTVTPPSVTLPPPEPEPVPEPEPEPTPEPEPATTTEEVPPILPPDTDNDGLTDAEEGLYGTSATSTDSDGDGYSDSVEVLNLYNPAGFKPTKLIEAGLVKEHVDQAEPYQILYPSSWSVSAGASQPTTFTTGGGETISIVPKANPQGQSVLDWYLSNNPGVSPVQVQSFYTKSGLEGVRSPDSLRAYVAINGSIYELSYAIGPPNGAYARTTFTMMLNSFRKKP